MLMFRCEIENNRPLACLTEPVNPRKIMQYPTCRRMLNPFTFVVGKRGFSSLSAWRMRYSKAAYTHKHTVISMNNAMMRSGFLR